MLKKFAQGETQLNADYLDRCLHAVGQSRNERCFAEIHNHYAGRVKSYLLSKGIVESTAEKLTQLIMLAVWRTSDTYDPTQAAASTWIFTIARNLWIERYRDHPRVDIEADDEMLQMASSTSIYPISNTPNDRIVKNESLIDT